MKISFTVSSFMYVSQSNFTILDWISVLQSTNAKAMNFVLINIKSCVVLFQHGAVVNVADLWKFTPLHEASAKGKFEICRLLLKVQ